MIAGKNKRGPLHRISSAEITKIGEVLRHAILYMEPADFTQRKMVAKYFPEIYRLRAKGYTFKQISELISECDTKISETTLRIYFNDMLPDRIDECKRTTS